MQNTPRSGFLGATGSLLPVFSRCTGGQAASGTQTGGVKIESISCRSASLDEIATTVITVEEQTRGWLGLIRRHTDVHRQVAYYERLVRLFDFFAEWQILLFDSRAAAEFKRLRQQRIRIGTMDLKIASIVLVNGGTLLSGNNRDFQQVPGRQVEDWLQS
jgi:tRNA(fMet)-specific endonuclease VapC